MNITGVIQDISVEKEGVSIKTGKPWTKYAVMINDQKFGTFDGKDYKVGQTGTFDYEDGQYGKTLIKKARAKDSEIIARLTTIEDLLMNITKMLSKPISGNAGNGISTPVQPEEIKIDDIPF